MHHSHGTKDEQPPSITLAHLRALPQSLLAPGGLLLLALALDRHGDVRGRAAAASVGDRVGEAVRGRLARLQTVEPAVQVVALGAVGVEDEDRPRSQGHGRAHGAGVAVDRDHGERIAVGVRIVRENVAPDRGIRPRRSRIVGRQGGGVRLIDASGVFLAGDAELAAGLRTSGLKGSYTAEQALERSSLPCIQTGAPPVFQRSPFQVLPGRQSFLRPDPRLQGRTYQPAPQFD